jgi:hypothetical protein
MANQELKELLEAELELLADFYTVCGVVDQTGRVYPLGADTKVLSSVFELISRPSIYRVAKKLGLVVVEAEVQNHYPDFTLMKDVGDHQKIAVDIKTTYRNDPKDTFGYTLGGYTSFIRNERKNIVFPYSQYSEHWVIGFVYDRLAKKKAGGTHEYTTGDLKDIPLPFENVEVFVQEKWRISSDRAGSGNTTNIGSIVARLDDFVAGRGVFDSEDEFLEYWRSYGRTAGDRQGAYSNIGQFRALKKR